MSVERYALDSGEMEVHRNGGYVLHADYEELERYGRQADITIENLQLQVEKLAAENAGLKSAISNIQGAIELACAGINDDRRGCVFKDILNAVYMKTHSETQNTYAFLAEVRAQGVEMFAKYIALYNSNSEQHAHSFAAQLRKGAI